MMKPNFYYAVSSLNFINLSFDSKNMKIKFSNHGNL
jgi:hypothetical protein